VYAREFFEHLQLDVTLVDSTKIGETVEKVCVSKLYPGVYYQRPVDRRVLLHWMQQSFIVTNSSKSEGQSNALSEAMLMKTIVVARDNSGNKDLIENQVDGFLFHSANEWEGICESLIHDDGEEKKQRMIEHAYAKIRSFEVFEYEAWKAILTG
jgi:glycosyltransferase involved in cell wall biosynthesis